MTSLLVDLAETLFDRADADKACGGKEEGQLDAAEAVRLLENSMLNECNEEGEARKERTHEGEYGGVGIVSKGGKGSHARGGVWQVLSSRGM